MAELVFQILYSTLLSLQLKELRSMDRTLRTILVYLWHLEMLTMMAKQIFLLVLRASALVGEEYILFTERYSQVIYTLRI